MAIEKYLIYGKCVNSITLNGITYSVGSWIPFPHEYIDEGSFKVTPDQKLELKAYRDNNAYMRRTTAPYDKSRVDFSTFAMQDVPDLQKIRDWLYATVYNTRENKLDLKIWNPRKGAYQTINASYMTDIEFPIIHIKNNNIKYDSIQWTFIQY